MNKMQNKEKLRGHTHFKSITEVCIHVLWGAWEYIRAYDCKGMNSRTSLWGVFFFSLWLQTSLGARRVLVSWHATEVRLPQGNSSSACAGTAAGRVGGKKSFKQRQNLLLQPLSRYVETCVNPGACWKVALSAVGEMRALVTLRCSL